MDDELVNGSVVAEASANKVLGAAIHVDAARARHQPGDRPATISLAQIVERQRHGQPAMPAVAEGEPVGAGSGPCLGGLTYGNGWAAKLPADLPMHPFAKLQEAAGYSTGRTDKEDDWILAGTKGAAAYYVIVGPAAKGETPVDYVWASGS